MAVRVSGSHLIITLRRPRANWMPRAAGWLAWVAAAIHLVLTPEHFEERFVYGVFFLAASLFQLVLGWFLLFRPDPRVYRAGAIGSLVLIATWIVTRAVAPPLSPEGGAELVTLLGVLATGAELATLVLLATAMPVPSATRRWTRWAWGAAAGIPFAGLFLLASGALSYVSFAGNPPSLNLLSPAFSLNYPVVYGLLLPHLWVVGSWSTFVFIAIAAVLVAANVATVTGRQAVAPECNPRPRGLLAVAPSLFAVSSCCGIPLALFLGAGAIGFLFKATPWLLLVTIAMLVANLMVMRRAARDSVSGETSKLSERARGVLREMGPDARTSGGLP